MSAHFRHRDFLKKILNITIKNASRRPIKNTATREIILARPSFIPGIGTIGGICISIINIIRDMAVNIEISVIVFTFILIHLLQRHHVD